MKRLVYIILLLVIAAHTGEVFAQRSAAEDYRFGTYLIGKGLLRDARVLTQSLPTDYTPEALDSMRHLSGWTLYNAQEFRLASQEFARVGTTSPLYPKSLFFGTICDLESGNTEGAKRRLESFEATPAAHKWQQLLALQRGGIALIEGDQEEFRRQRELFTLDSYALADQQRTLCTIADTRPKELSAWVAGVASAIVPGLGKIYAGDIGGGVASFMMVGAFAALTATSWAKAESPLNWRTMTYGAIGSLLYISNICGSVASVRVYYQNFEEINRRAVMYSIHIPLRELFE